MDEVYVQTTPIPENLHPPNEMEVLAYAASARKDPFRAFLDDEKQAFDEWTDYLPLTMVDFVQGYPTRFLLLVSWAPKEECELLSRVRYLIDDIQSGAVMGDKGTSIGGIRMDKRARWTVTHDGLNKHLAPSARRLTMWPTSPAHRRFLTRHLLFCFLCVLIAALLLFLTR